MPRPHRVVVLLLPPVVGYDAAIPPLLFGEAVDADGLPLYEVTTAGLTTGPVPTTAGYSIIPTADVTALDDADTVVVPGTRAGRGGNAMPGQAIAALQRIRPGTRIVSICTGAFVLASAGLLDGRPATTHWAHAEEFRSAHPDVALDENLLYVDDGDVLSSAGLSAGIDLCLHIIRRDHGSAVANRAAKYCVVPPWRDGGQAQFIDRPGPAVRTGGAASTAAVQDWARAHLDRPLDVARLADQARMSVRTFNRRFREETGTSPGVWLARQRLDHARHLLETTDLPVDAIATRAGMGTAASLRARLRDSLGTSPSAYRRTFRGAGPVGPHVLERDPVERDPVEPGLVGSDLVGSGR